MAAADEGAGAGTTASDDGAGAAAASAAAQDPAAFYAALDAVYATGDRDAVERFLLDAVGESGAADMEDPACGGGAWGETPATDETGTAGGSHAVAARDSAPDPLSRVPALNELGSFYRSSSRFDASARMFGRALAALDANGMAGSPQRAVVLMNCAGTERMAGRPQVALARFAEVLGMLERAGMEGTFEYASTLNNMALALQDSGEREDALRRAQEALEIMRGLPGHGSDVAAGLGNVAQMRLMTGDIPGARRDALEAIDLFERLDDRGAHYASALSAVGLTYLRERSFQEAVSWLERACERVLRALGENLDYAMVCADLADALDGAGEPRRAADLRATAAELRKRYRGDENAQAEGRTPAGRSDAAGVPDRCDSKRSRT